MGVTLFNANGDAWRLELAVRARAPQSAPQAMRFYPSNSLIAMICSAT
jgi:hypothetical protein